MLRKLLPALFLLIFSTGLFAVTAKYNRVIVFGDSYSDNGNLFELSGGQYPDAARYFKGRFSNGLVWVEYLAQDLYVNPGNPNRFIDLAYGQAKVLAPTSIKITGNKPHTYPIPDFAEQIQHYVKKHKAFKANDLVIVFIGTNDFFDQPILSKSFFIHIADQETKDIHKLVKMGAKHIIVLNGRDVAYLPLANIYAHLYAKGASVKAQKQYLANFRVMVKAYNQQLAQDLKGMPEVFLYDTFAFDNHIIQKINKGGYPYTFRKQHDVLKVAKTSCYQNNQGDYQNTVGAMCGNPETYFFYDRIHTTTNVNYLLAQDVFKKFNKR